MSPRRLGNLGSLFVTHPSLIDYTATRAELLETANDLFAMVASGKIKIGMAYPEATDILGKPRDVMTLAHELGHGVHQVLAAPNGALMAPTPLTLAETASVFGEMLTFRRLLTQTKDRKQRQALLAAMEAAGADSKFTLVTLAAMRAREINDYYGQLGEGLGKIVPPQVRTLNVAR